MKNLPTAAFAACLFVLIVAAKWATFDAFGSAMPDWDQWDAEASELFIPWFQNDHFLTHLVNPHNEHRVVLTKLQNLALGLINGQWDSRLEAATNALLHAAIGVALWLFGCRCVMSMSRGKLEGCGRGSVFLRALLFVITFALFGLPVAWQNVLGGFHSQQFWLLGLSFAAIVTLPFVRSWSVGWWVGALAAILALGSMASGFLAAVVVVVVIVFRRLRRETTWSATWPALLVCAVAIAVGAYTRVEPEWHQNLKAKTVHDFFFSIVHSMQWPLRERHWAAAVLWLPWALVAWICLRSKSSGRSAQALAALGGWVIVQLVATAYARGADAGYPASRYMDTLAFGAMINALALAWLLALQWRRPGSFSARIVLATFAAGWIVTLGVGLHKLCSDVLLIELPGVKDYYLKAEANVRCYLGANDPKELSYPEIPFPSADALIDRLANPHLRALMPVPIRAPLTIVPAAPSTAFVENDARGSRDSSHSPQEGLTPLTPPLDAAKSWGSFTRTEGAVTQGEWRSRPIAPSDGWLKIDLAGYPGDKNDAVRLDLIDAETGAHLATVRPNRVPANGWRPAYVRAPRRPYLIVARDNSTSEWLAFSGPTEMGALSYRALWLTKHGLLILAITAAACLGLAALLGIRCLVGRHSQTRADALPRVTT